MTPQPSPALNLLEDHGGELAFGGRGHAPPHQQFAFSPPPTALHIRDSLARRMCCMLVAGLCQWIIILVDTSSFGLAKNSNLQYA